MGSITGLGGEIVAFTYPALLKVSDNDILPSTTGGGRKLILLMIAYLMYKMEEYV